MAAHAGLFADRAVPHESAALGRGVPAARQAPAHDAAPAVLPAIQNAALAARHGCCARGIRGCCVWGIELGGGHSFGAFCARGAGGAASGASNERLMWGHGFLPDRELRSPHILGASQCRCAERGDHGRRASSIASAIGVFGGWQSLKESKC